MRRSVLIFPGGEADFDESKIMNRGALVLAKVQSKQEKVKEESQTDSTTHYDLRASSVLMPQKESSTTEYSMTGSTIGDDLTISTELVIPPHSLSQVKTTSSGKVCHATSTVAFVLKERLWACQNQCFVVKQIDDEKVFPNGLNTRIKFSEKKGRSKMIWRDDNKHVLAVSYEEEELEQTEDGSWTLKVYSSTPTQPGQRPSKSCPNSRVKLYRWARVISSPTSSRSSLSIYDGDDFVDTYTYNRGRRYTEKEHHVKNKEGEVCAIMGRSNESSGSKSWKISILPGNDPCLMLCFAASIDESLHRASIAGAQSLRDLAVSLSNLMPKSAGGASEKSLGEADSGESVNSTSSLGGGLTTQLNPNTHSGRAA